MTFTEFHHSTSEIHPCCLESSPAPQKKNIKYKSNTHSASTLFYAYLYYVYHHHHRSSLCWFVVLELFWVNILRLGSVLWNIENLTSTQKKSYKSRRFGKYLTHTHEPLSMANFSAVFPKRSTNWTSAPFLIKKSVTRFLPETNINEYRKKTSTEKCSVIFWFNFTTYHEVPHDEVQSDFYHRFD